VANEGSTRMTTTQLRAMIAGGATRSQLPTKANGGSVSSTVDSAQRAYLAAIQKAERTRKFKEAQKTTPRQEAQKKTIEFVLQNEEKIRRDLAARKARECVNCMISVSENTKVMPSYDAQSQKFNNSISNNNVNPAALYTPQPVNSNNNSQNSSVGGGVNVNANYNYATQMNDFQNQNPTSQVNMGQAPQGYGYTAGKSSIPIENEVKTSLLGGDIQHQESDINTNVSYLPEINDPQDTIKKIAIGGVGIAGIGAAVLLAKALRVF
tara:strand:+ start:153 stop:950 length:798 start_codon:yes stop_codon:yes gene_type:complete